MERGWNAGHREYCRGRHLSGDKDVRRAPGNSCSAARAAATVSISRKMPREELNPVIGLSGAPKLRTRPL